MKLSGIDTGEPVGLATLEWDGLAFHWVDSREIPSSQIDEIVDRCALVIGIERPRGFYPSKGMLAAGGGKLASIAEGLIHAAWVGGVLAGIARASGKRAFDIAAPDARRAIGVRIGGRTTENDVDKQIADLVPTLIRGWPRRGFNGERINSKATRDAAVAAMFALQLERSGHG